LHSGARPGRFYANSVFVNRETATDWIDIKLIGEKTKSPASAPRLKWFSRTAANSSGCQHRTSFGDRACRAHRLDRPTHQDTGNLRATSQSSDVRDASPTGDLHQKFASGVSACSEGGLNLSPRARGRRDDRFFGAACRCAADGVFWRSAPFHEPS